MFLLPHKDVRQELRHPGGGHVVTRAFLRNVINERCAAGGLRQGSGDVV